MPARDARVAEQDWPATFASLASLRQATPGFADVVVWMSEHLAALGHVVRPAAERVLGASSGLLMAEVDNARELERTLQSLHGRLTGNSAAMDLSVAQLHRELIRLLAERLVTEADLAAELYGRLDAAEWDALARRYASAAADGPTRPHPRAPHDGWLGRVAFRVLSLADHLMDAVDSRPVHVLPTATAGVFLPARAA